MTDAQTGQGHNRVARWLALVAGCGVTLVLALGLGAYAHAEQQLQTIHYKARILSATPDTACIQWIQGSGDGMLARLLQIADTLPFPIRNLPQSKPSEEVMLPDDPQCNAAIEVEMEVSNPLPLRLRADIHEVEMTLAGQPMESQQIRYPSPTASDGLGGPLRLTFVLHVQIEQVLAAGSQIVLRRKLPMKAFARVEVSTLGGLMVRQLGLPLEREFTEGELLQGAVTGTIAAQE
ncbi:MAG: hypothetical protein AAFX99_05990 [Myxococcota bacterium]